MLLTDLMRAKAYIEIKNDFLGKWQGYFLHQVK